MDLKNRLLSFVRGRAPFPQAVLFSFLSSALWVLAYFHVFPWCCQEWHNSINALFYNDQKEKWFYYSMAETAVLFSYEFFAVFCLWKCARNIEQRKYRYLAKGTTLLIALLLVVLFIVITNTVDT